MSAPLAKGPGGQCPWSLLVPVIGYSLGSATTTFKGSNVRIRTGSGSCTSVGGRGMRALFRPSMTAGRPRVVQWKNRSRGKMNSGSLHCLRIRAGGLHRESGPARAATQVRAPRVHPCSHPASPEGSRSTCCLRSLRCPGTRSRWVCRQLRRNCARPPLARVIHVRSPLGSFPG